jgi:ADP-ribosyl-[dinitrogen reductase] hydrolase
MLQYRDRVSASEAYPVAMSRPRTSAAQRAEAAYLGLALGDALGATVEFMTPREIQAEYGTHDQIRGGGWLRLKPGQVTDDTTMSLALGESILEHGGVEADAVARAFDAWMRAKPVDIGNTVRRGILNFRLTGLPVTPPSDHDAGNGAAMRVLPVALATYGAPARIVTLACQAQAHVTHHNTLSDSATECLADMLQLALAGVDKDVLLLRARELARRTPAFAFEACKPRQNPSGFIVDTMQAVFQAFFGHDDFRPILVNVVNRGGDADTTGAIAGMLAGAHYGSAALPADWLRRLDATTAMRCRAQAGALLELADAGLA